jgi:DnaJ family protein A protein 2
LLPSKKTDIEPLPEIVDEVAFEESTLTEFGEGDENDWEDEDGDDEEDGPPECQPQ